MIEAVSQQRSAWTRADVLQAFCDLQRPVSQQSGHEWAATLARVADHVLVRLVDLDPPGGTIRRDSDGRSVWLEPTAPRFTSEPVLAQEEAIVTWALAAQADSPAPSPTVDPSGLDPLQADAAAAVSGKDRLVLVVGPAGAGKTRMLSTAASDLSAQGRTVFAVAPTAKAARTVKRDTGISADTVAKLLHEHQRTDRPPLSEFELPPGATLVVDEAGMLSTPALYEVVSLAERNSWRLALVGDPRQLQGVGRGGLLAELCANGRVEQLERLHRFSHPWEAAASLKLRSGDPRALDAYEAHGRILAGTLDDHLDQIADAWIRHLDTGRSIAVVASTNDHVDTLNRAVQTARLDAGHLDATAATRLAAGDTAYVGDVIATRRNDRRLIATSGEPVRNRDTWTITALNRDGSITVAHQGGHGDVVLPADYVREHARLGYAATEHGWQSDTVDTAIALTSPATTRRGLYVAATRGRDHNTLCVITDSDDVAEARDVLEAILATDRADVPATTQRRNLAQSTPREATFESRRSPRCQIPDWFPAALAAAKRNLLDAQIREAQRAAQQAQANAVAANADAAAANAAAATATDRDALHQAEARATEARRRLTAATHRLDTCPRRQRRSVRLDVHLAEQQLERAEDYLERTQMRTAPALERHAQAVHDQRAAREQLQGRDTPDGFDVTVPAVGEHRLHVQALNTWRHWAEGHDVPRGSLQTAYAVLARRPDDEQQLAAPLRHDLARTQVGHTIRGTTRLDVPLERVPQQDLGIEL